MTRKDLLRDLDNVRRDMETAHRRQLDILSQILQAIEDDKYEDPDDEFKVP